MAFSDKTTGRQGFRRAWFYSEGVGYIEPNDFGPVGYALIPILAALFRRLVVHQPRPQEYEAARKTGKYAMPPWSTIEECALEPSTIGKGTLIRVVGYPEYVKGPDVADCTRKFRANIIAAEDRRPEVAQKLLKNVLLPMAQDIKDPAHRIIHIESEKERLPRRYANVVDGNVEFYQPGVRPLHYHGQTFLPNSWETEWTFLDTNTQVYLLVLYDMVTDDMAAASGGANRLHYPFDSFSWVSLPETRVNSPLLKEFSPDEIVEILGLVIPRLVCDDTSLSKETILAFRREERDYFLQSLDHLIRKLESLRKDVRKDFADKWVAKENRRIRLPATCLNTLVAIFAANQLGLSYLLAVIGASLGKGFLTRRVPGIAEDAKVFGKHFVNFEMRRVPLLRKAGEAYASLLRKWE